MNKADNDPLAIQLDTRQDSFMKIFSQELG